MADWSLATLADLDAYAKKTDLPQDTGWVDIPAINPASWVDGAIFRARRIGTSLLIHIDATTTGGPSNAWSFVDLPPGFRPPVAGVCLGQAEIDNSRTTLANVINVAGLGYISAYAAVSRPAGTRLRALIQTHTFDGWPTSL